MPTDDLRDRLIARLLASWSIADDPVSQAMARRAAERDADTMLAAWGNVRELLADASKHLRALCHIGRHDDMGENLGCAACALTARIETALNPTGSVESHADGRTGLNAAHETREAPQGSQERSER